MKNIWKKNQVIITALVIMVAVAGYLNFTDEKLSNALLSEEGSIETAALTEAEATSQPEETASEESLATPEADNTESEESMSDGNTSDLQDAEDVADISEEDILDSEATSADTAQDTEGKESAGEAVFTSGTASDLFYSAKLTREQTRAKNKEMLLELVNNGKLSEKQKNEAVNKIIEMTAIAEKENAAEILLGAKGFENSVVSILEDSVDVVIDAESLTDQQSVQIEDIVKRKTEVAPDKIVISLTGKKAEKKK